MDSFLGPKQVVLPQRVIEEIYEQGVAVIGMYCLIARHASQRGRARVPREQIVADSKLEPEVAEEAINWLWREKIIEYHQIVSHDGEITDEFFYIVSQDKTGRGGD